MKFKILLITGLILLLTPLATSALAAPSVQGVTCENEYVVQADDWLSKLADRYYSDMLAYPAIVAATNQMAATDDSFTTITNPDVIEIGQKLCIPPADAVEGLIAGGEGETLAPPPAAPKLVLVDSVDVEMVDGDYVATLTGNFPDGCSTMGETETTVTGNTISVTVLADSPPGVMCTMALIPFEETVVLDLGEVDPGEYTVVVNDSATTTLTVN